MPANEATILRHITELPAWVLLNPKPKSRAAVSGHWQAARQELLHPHSARLVVAYSRVPKCYFYDILKFMFGPINAGHYNVEASAVPEGLAEGPRPRAC